jgi:hypothetical protein
MLYAGNQTWCLHPHILNLMHGKPTKHHPRLARLLGADQPNNPLHALSLGRGGLARLMRARLAWENRPLVVRPSVRVRTPKSNLCLCCRPAITKQNRLTPTDTDHDQPAGARSSPTTKQKKEAPRVRVQRDGLGVRYGGVAARGLAVATRGFFRPCLNLWMVHGKVEGTKGTRNSMD